MFSRPGYVQTGRAFFKLKVQGKGGHGSSPHMANDVIVKVATSSQRYKPLYLDD